MSVTLSSQRFFALKWVMRRNAVQICVGANAVKLPGGNVWFAYFRDNSAIMLSDAKIVIMPYRGDHITITKGKENEL